MPRRTLVTRRGGSASDIRTGMLWHIMPVPSARTVLSCNSYATSITPVCRHAITPVLPTLIMPLRRRHHQPSWFHRHVSRRIIVGAAACCFTPLRPLRYGSPVSPVAVVAPLSLVVTSSQPFQYLRTSRTFIAAEIRQNHVYVITTGIRLTSPPPDIPVSHHQ